MWLILFYMPLFLDARITNMAACTKYQIKGMPDSFLPHKKGRLTYFDSNLWRELFLLLCYNRNRMTVKPTDIRPSPLAGRWYPANPKKLAESVDSYIQAAQLPEIKGEILALVSPHAGHLYSGPVAGYAFKAIMDLHPELIVILSPCHQYHPAAILTSGHQAYQTPLGDIAVDQEALEFVSQSLHKTTGVELTKVRNDNEHAIEIILPFLQRSIQRGFTFLPLMLRRQDPVLMKSLSDVLAELISSRKTLLVASTDLSHFHTAGEANQMDQTIIKGIQMLDPESLYWHSPHYHPGMPGGVIREGDFKKRGKYAFTKSAIQT